MRTAGPKAIDTQPFFIYSSIVGIYLSLDHLASIIIDFSESNHRIKKKKKKKNPSKFPYQSLYIYRLHQSEVIAWAWAIGRLVMLSKKPAKAIYRNAWQWKCGKREDFISQVQLCDFSPMSQIVLWSAENIISTFSEQQSMLTLTSHLWFSSNSIISFILLYWKDYLKTPNANNWLMRDSRKECEKGRAYFLTSCIRFTSSSSEPPMSKKSSTTVASTILLAHDIRASESSGEKKGGCTREVTVGLFLSS